jgi:hypothetical protein
MPHEDQFTATGPAFEGAGFSRAAFSTGRPGTDSTYGVNVQGSACGVYGECVNRTPQNESTRTSRTSGTGVSGKGDLYGVFGEGQLAGVCGFIVQSAAPGVLGDNFGDGPGVVGLSHSLQASDFLGQGAGLIGASNQGSGVVGLSLKKVEIRPEVNGGGFVAPTENTSADGEGTGVKGASGTGTGVFGESSSGPGLTGQSDSGIGVVGRSTSGVGGFFTSVNKEAVVGHTGGAIDAVLGIADSGAGIKGESNGGFGVFGQSTNQAGVFGTASAAFKLPVPPAGVFGVNDKSVGVLGSSLQVIGVWGSTNSGIGVFGTTNEGVGVPTNKITDQGIGVIGLANSGVGAAGMSTSGTGVFGSSESGLAGHFKGPVTIEGALTIIGGTKSAAVPHTDGSYRQMYCMESPESWFEDFGEASLVNGKGEVQLDPDFAALVDLNNYQIFLTAYGDSKGIFVAARNATAFQVSEQQGGTSNVSYAYRVVAKRKDVAADRLARVTLPDVSSKTQLPDGRLKIASPDFARLSVDPVGLTDPGVRP